MSDGWGILLSGLGLALVFGFLRRPRVLRYLAETGPVPRNSSPYTGPDASLRTYKLVLTCGIVLGLLMFIGGAIKVIAGAL